MILAISIGFFVFLIYRTELIKQYGTIFGLKKLLKLNDYEEWLANNWREKDYWNYCYPVFIRETIKGGKITEFASHLFGCPICLITFSSLISCLFVNCFIFLFVAALATLTFFILDWFYRK